MRDRSVLLKDAGNIVLSEDFSNEIVSYLKAHKKVGSSSMLEFLNCLDVYRIKWFPNNKNKGNIDRFDYGSVGEKLGSITLKSILFMDNNISVSDVADIICCNTQIELEELFNDFLRGFDGLWISAYSLIKFLYNKIIIDYEKYEDEIKERAMMSVLATLIYEKYDDIYSRELNKEYNTSISKQYAKDYLKFILEDNKSTYNDYIKYSVLLIFDNMCKIDSSNSLENTIIKVLSERDELEFKDFANVAMGLVLTVVALKEEICRVTYDKYIKEQDRATSFKEEVRELKKSTVSRDSISNLEKQMSELSKEKTIMGTEIEELYTRIDEQCFEIERLQRRLEDTVNLLNTYKESETEEESAIHEELAKEEVEQVDLSKYRILLVGKEEFQRKYDYDVYDYTAAPQRVDILLRYDIVVLLLPSIHHSMSIPIMNYCKKYNIDYMLLRNTNIDRIDESIKNYVKFKRFT